MEESFLWQPQFKKTGQLQVEVHAGWSPIWAQQDRHDMTVKHTAELIPLYHRICAQENVHLQPPGLQTKAHCIVVWKCTIEILYMLPPRQL